MRLVHLGQAGSIWVVLAIKDKDDHSVWDELLAAGPGNSGVTTMRATLATDVPLNGPPTHNRTKCRDLGRDIFEFKQPGVRVLWFYAPGERRRIVCTHHSAKVHKKEFQKEITKAVRMRKEYILAKQTGNLTIEPPRKPKVS